MMKRGKTGTEKELQTEFNNEEAAKWEEEDIETDASLLVENGDIAVTGTIIF